MWRNMDKESCIRNCDRNRDCKTYLYAEGHAHQYTGTCEIYNGIAHAADGNGGWSCYPKSDCHG